MKLPIALAVGTAMLASVAAQAADDPSIWGEKRADVQSAMLRHINDRHLDGKYVMFDGMDASLMQLTFDDLHKGIVRKGEFFVSCADFRDAYGEIYDLDFLVADTDEGYRVMQTVVHKVGNEKRKYTVE